MRRKDKSTGLRKKIYSLFILFIMVGSIFAVIFYGFASGGATQRYNGFKFSYRGDHWEAKVEGKQAAFLYLPNEVEYISLPEDVKAKLKSAAQFDVTSAANDSNGQAIALAQYQMDLTLRNFNVFIRSGFTGNNSFGKQIITCKDATQFVPVVYFSQGNKTDVHLEGNCIVAELAGQADALRVKDRIVYSILEII
jgi:hypothetical protein